MQLQVDVVEVRRAGRDLGRAQALGLDRRERLGGGVAVQRHRDPGADRERVVAGDARVRSSPAPGRVSVDAELEDLAAEAGRAAPGGCRARRAPRRG